jgi:hypothetical protein
LSHAPGQRRHFGPEAALFSGVNNCLECHSRKLTRKMVIRKRQRDQKAKRRKDGRRSAVVGIQYRLALLRCSLSRGLGWLWTAVGFRRAYARGRMSETICCGWLTANSRQAKLLHESCG